MVAKSTGLVSWSSHQCQFSFRTPLGPEWSVPPKEHPGHWSAGRRYSMVQRLGASGTWCTSTKMAPWFFHRLPNTNTHQTCTRLHTGAWPTVERAPSFPGTFKSELVSHNDVPIIRPCTYDQHDMRVVQHTYKYKYFTISWETYIERKRYWNEGREKENILSLMKWKNTFWKSKLILPW